MNDPTTTEEQEPLAEPLVGRDSAVDDPADPGATGESVRQERRSRCLAEAIPIGILYTDRTGSVDDCNAQAEALLGRTRNELVGRRWLDDLDLSAGGPLTSAATAAACGGPEAMFDFELRRADDSTVWLQSRIAPVLDDDGDDDGVIVLFEDISARRRLEQKLRHQASHDHLTGLPNRREFRAHLCRRLAALDAGETIGVLLVDLDQFKLVNDTYGQDAGDEMIVTVGERLVESVAPGTLVGRLGGDEFVVALVARHQGDVLEAADAVRQTLRRPARISGVELSLSVSIGVGTANDPRTPASTLLRRADIAMHHAKIRRDVVEVFDTSMEEDVARQLALTSELRRAVDAEAIRVHYQPLFDTASSQIVGLEALARWTHPEWGAIGPDEFIPIAESMGLVHEIDRQVLTTAVNQLGDWRAAGRIGPEVFVSVNLSASQLTNSRLPDLVQHAVELARVDGSGLCVEVTEGALIADLSRAVPILERLRGLGVRIAVDDFGTGHSALGYLSQLPLDVLKIDRSFVEDLGSGSVELAEVIVDLGHRFGLSVVAEGVETPAQLARLRELGCDMIQGFLTGRPVEPELAVPAVERVVPVRSEREASALARAWDPAFNDLSA